MKYRECTIDDIKAPEKGSIISGPFGSNISSKYFVSSGLPVIRGNNLSLSYEKFIDGGFVYITQEKAEELNCWAKEGDLIFTAAGTIGQVGLLDGTQSFERYVISNKQLRVRLDSNIIDVLYAYYWFSSPWTKTRLIRNNVGSTVPLITLREVKELPIIFPIELKYQRRIAQVIDNISQKIKLNNEINTELENIAKLLYDYWFVQYDFPDENGKPYRSSGGIMVYNDKLKKEIPIGWELLSVNDMTTACRGVTFDKDDVITYSENSILVLRGNNIQDNKLVYDNNTVYIPDSMVSSEQRIRKHDIILTMSSGSKNHIGKCAMFQNDSKHTFGAFLTKFTPSTDKCFFVFQSLVSDFCVQRIKSICNGTGINNLTNAHFDEILFAVPNKTILEMFEERLRPLYTMIGNNVIISSELTALRDFLLPLLMNGQVTVKESK